ncbi:SPASM domain-containing protein, partial [Desulforudis sp. 1190]
YAKARCRACWAKFLCSGGCHAAAFLQNGSILEPYDVGCRLMHKRLECALFIKARELERRCQREISGDS